MLFLHVFFQRVLQKEKQRMENVTTANAKLLHECEILRNRLQECGVNFLVEEEDKLIVDTSSSSDAIDLLTTSDNRIGLLLAEVTSASYMSPKNKKTSSTWICFAYDDIFGAHFYRISVSRLAHLMHGNFFLKLLIFCF